MLKIISIVSIIIINFMQFIVPCQYRTAYNTVIQNYCIIIVMTKALIFLDTDFHCYTKVSQSLYLMPNFGELNTDKT